MLIRKNFQEHSKARRQMSMPDTISTYLAQKKKIVDCALDGFLRKSSETPAELSRAMRYSALAGGKRLRPILCMAAAEAVGGNEKDVLPAACALELIHTHSLIYDDLPCMDDDDYRRGKPTNHKVFGEAAAVLAGDALLVKAFELLSDMTRGKKTQIPACVRLRAVNEIAYAIGDRGLCAGQIIDLASEGGEISPRVLKYIHVHKTAALIVASVRCGALLGGADEKQLKALTKYAECTGLAFQIQDDVLDVLGDEKKLGKKAGQDEKMGKNTYPKLFGIEVSKKKAAALKNEAVDALRAFDKKADALRGIADFFVRRDF